MIPGRRAGATGLRYALPQTRTENDEAIAAGFAAYPEPADGPTRADLEEEAEWWAGFKARTDAGEIDPHDWPRETEGPLLEGLHRADEATRGLR